MNTPNNSNMTKNNIQNIWTWNWNMNMMWLFVPSLWIGHTTMQWYVDRGSPVHYDTNTKKGNSGICHPECYSDIFVHYNYWSNQILIESKIYRFEVFWNFWELKPESVSNLYRGDGVFSCLCLLLHRPGWQILELTSNILLQWEKHCVLGIF